MRLPKSITVSVYVDDIILSGTNRNQLLEVSNTTLNEFAQCGFPLSDTKTEICKEKITSFNVHLSHLETSITNDRMSKFKEQIAENIHHEDSLAGIHGYVASINIDQAKEIETEIGRLRGS